MKIFKTLGCLLLSLINKAQSVSTNGRPTMSLLRPNKLAPFYTDACFERKSPSSNEFEAMLTSAATQFVPMSKGNNFYDADLRKGIYLSTNDLKTSESFLPLFIYLGSKSGVDYIAVDLEESKLPSSLTGEGVKCANLRSFSEEIDDMDEAALLAYARGMTVWHNNAKFCPKCGSSTVSRKCGSSRKCTNEDCKASSYPRIEPATIMLITNRDNTHCLLGRKEGWPSGRYSALAGFTEVGESLEQTAAREVFEESGVEVDRASLQFVASQPWPFPYSLMVGFIGKCAEEGLPVVNFDPKEMQVIVTILP
jgi:NAD+ diphosphatase